MRRIQMIDLITVDDHYHIGADDECYYLVNYVSNQGYKYSPENGLMFNFKKKIERKGQPDWKYKSYAIDEFAKMLREIDFSALFGKKYYLIPVPPSKCKTDPLYDDRVVKVLQKVFPAVSIVELISQTNSTPEYHNNDDKRDIDEIKNNYTINNELLPKIDDDIPLFVIFDDVLTTGAHYIAIKQKIKEVFPISRVVGLFLARRQIIYENPFEDFM